MSRKGGIQWGKPLTLRRLRSLHDNRLQYQVSDRLSFMRFPGLELSCNVPDTSTVWAFRAAIKERELADALFERLNQAQADLGIEFKRGQIIDDALDPIPSPSDGHENNAIIKSDAAPV